MFVPSDCVVSETGEENRNALKQMEKVLKADIRSSPELNLEEMKKKSDPADCADHPTSSNPNKLTEDGEADLIVLDRAR